MVPTDHEDDSENSRAEHALRASEAKYRSLFDSIDDGFCIVEVLYDKNMQPVDHRILEANPAFKEHTNLEPFVGEVASEQLPQIKEESWHEIYARVVASGRTTRFEQYSPTFNRWFEVAVSRVGDESLHQVAVLFRDISERKRAEEALQLHHSWLTMAMRAMNAGWGSWNLLTGETQWSEEAKRIIGFQGDEEARTAEGWLKRIHPEDRPRLEAHSAQAAAEHKEFNLEYRIVRDGGFERWLLGTGAILYDESGTAYLITGLIIDITERKQAEAALRESEDRYRTLLNSIDQGFARFEMLYEQGVPVDYRFLEVNRTFEHHTGLHGAVGKTARELVPDLEPHWFALYGQVVASGKTARFEQGSLAMGRLFEVEAVRVGLPEHHEVAVVFTDVTERRRSATELAAAAARDQFRIQLADALRPLSEAAAIEGEATRVLGEHLHASRVAYFEVQGEDYVAERYYSVGVHSPSGRFASSSFGTKQLATYRAGRTVVDPDVVANPDLSPAEQETYAAFQIGAHVGVPLLKDGRFVAGLIVHQTAPHAWTADEVALVEETAERTWDAVERARAETALRKSEERLGFLLTLSDSLRPLADPKEIHLIACRLLGTYLGVNRVFAADIEGDEFILQPGYDHGVPPFLGRGQVTDFGAVVFDAYRRGEIVAVSDIATDERFSAQERTTLQNAQIAAFAGVMRMTEGRLVGAFGLHSATPRVWTTAELTLLEEVARRVWAMTDYARLAQALRESEGHFRLMADTVPQIVWIADADGRMAFFNKQWSIYTGLAYEPTTAADAAAHFMHPDDGERVLAAFDEARRTGNTFAVEHRIRSAAGEDRWFLVRAEPYRDKQTGAIVQWFGASIDIHDRKQAEARLEQLYEQEQAARAEAEEASRLKDEFLATVSHELRTPLTAFLGYAQLLGRRTHDAAYVARTVEKMVQSAQAQAALTDDLLDVSRIVSGKLGIALQPTELRDVIHAALDTVRPTAEAKGIQIEVALNPSASAVLGDANRLQQVVWNLLANAAKFTPPGGRIAVQLAPHGSNAELRVSDSGRGIDADFLPYVFDRFRQADSSSQRTYGGLGLGLAIVRHLVELHGGTVEATSAGAGQGATFTVQLPLANMRDAANGNGSAIADGAGNVQKLPLQGLRVSTLR